jgi:hypothetical protein
MRGPAGIRRGMHLRGATAGSRSMRCSSAGSWLCAIIRAAASRRPMCGGSAGRWSMRGGSASSRPVSCSPAGSRSMRGAAGSRPMRGRSMRAAAAWCMRYRRSSRLLLSGCFTHSAEHQKAGKNHYCRAFANNPAEKLCCHQILFFPFIVLGLRLTHQAPTCYMNLAHKKAREEIADSPSTLGVLSVRALQPPFRSFSRISCRRCCR